MGFIVNIVAAFIIAIVISVVGLSPVALFAWYTGYIGHRRDRH